ncbi:MAG: hypothetical protein HOL23_03720 [Gammaproteobacteria bacterium]|nr:hypothetical protein [Gammaproteobacteria bacterium]
MKSYIFVDKMSSKIYKINISKKFDSKNKNIIEDDCPERQTKVHLNS